MTLGGTIRVATIMPDRVVRVLEEEYLVDPD